MNKVLEYNLHRFKDLKNYRRPNDDLYRAISRLIRIRNYQFSNYLDTPEEYRKTDFSFNFHDIYDDTAVQANQIFSSMILAMLWPNGAKSIKLESTLDEKLITNEIKEYFERKTEIFTGILDNSKSGLQTALSEFMLDQGAYCFSGIMSMENPDPFLPIRFKSLPALTTFIDEDPSGFVDTVYYLEFKTIRSCYLMYGKKCSEKVKKKFHEGKNLNDPIVVLRCIYPRFKPSGKGNRGLPYASCHIDLTNKHLMLESGYSEQPMFVSRLAKVPGEIYGRGPGIDALPSIGRANQIQKIIIDSGHKRLSPPLGTFSDADWANGTIDRRAGAVNVLSSEIRLEGRDPIFSIDEMRGSPTELIQTYEKIINNISKHFFIDRLLDLNNDTRMTAYEAGLRDTMRGQSLSSVLSRQDIELFTPLIERAYNVCFEAGNLGISSNDFLKREYLENVGVKILDIPEEVENQILEGKNHYKITFINPAQRIRNSEEAKGILATIEYLQSIAGLYPSAAEEVDPSIMTRKFIDLQGAPYEIKSTTESKDQNRAFRQQESERARAISEDKELSEIEKNRGFARQANADAMNKIGSSELV